MPSAVKDPDAVIDFSYEWANWLTGDEVVQTTDWDIPAGLTKDSVSLSDSISTVWLSGGTAGEDYVITCQVTTSEGRLDHRSILIRCRER